MAQAPARQRRVAQCRLGAPDVDLFRAGRALARRARGIAAPQGDDHCMETEMTGDDLRAARATLGEMWGLGRPLHMSELARALRLSGRDPGQTIRDWER